MKTIFHVKNHILTNLSRLDFLHVESHGWKGIIVFIYLFVFYQNTYFPLNIAVNLIFFLNMQFVRSFPHLYFIQGLSGLKEQIILLDHFT